MGERHEESLTGYSLYAMSLRVPGRVALPTARLLFARLNSEQRSTGVESPSKGSPYVFRDQKSLWLQHQVQMLGKGELRPCTSSESSRYGCMHSALHCYHGNECAVQETSMYCLSKKPDPMNNLIDSLAKSLASLSAETQQVHFQIS